MRVSGVVAAAAAVVSLLGLAACADDAPSSVAAPTSTAPATSAAADVATATPSAVPSPGAQRGGPASPSATATPTPTLPEVHDPVSLPALMRREYDGRGLRQGRVIDRTSAYTTYAATYRGDGLRISGTLHVPRGRGPFPGIVLAHGYIDPDVYTTGRGLRREQDLLARRGYVVLHTDYRNHAGSSRDEDAEVDLRLGYTVDTINAVLALKRFDAVDADRVALLGRSMGGGVVLNTLVVQPGLVDAAIVYAPVSSDAVDNYERWIRADRSSLARRIERKHGAPEQATQFWAGVSARTYFDRVTEPVLVHHGTADESCPIRWSRQTLDLLRDAGARARMYTYEGEPHAFGAAWPLSMERTVDFLERHLDA